MKRSIPLVLSLTMACGGDGAGPIEPTPVLSDITTMQVGEVRVLVPADMPNGLDLSSVPDPREFIIIVGNTSSIGDVVASYQVRGNLSAASSVQPEQRVRLAPQLLSAAAGLAGFEGPQQVLEGRIRGFERKALKLRSASSPLSSSGPSIRRNMQAAAVPVPGDILNLKIPDVEADTLCDSYFSTQAEVATVTDRAIIAVDTRDGPPSGVFPAADFQAIGEEFDDVTYPTEEAYFGTPTDIDANGRAIILYTGRVNELTPPSTAGSSGYTAGFFFGGDFFPPTGPPNASCAQSNEAEIFYLLVPDPLGVNYGNTHSAASVRQTSRAIIAHEFQHMINAGRRYTGGVARQFESAWLDEALAHLATEVVGRRVRGFTDLQSLSFSDISPNEAARNDFNAFFGGNLSNLRRWMEAPQAWSGISRDADSILASRGAAWALIRYAADNFSNSNPSAFTRRLAAGPDTGMSNFNRGTGAPLDTVLAGWLVANYADNLPGFPVANARTQYRSFNMRSVMPPVTPGQQYPLKVESVGSGTAIVSGTNRTGTGTYYRLTVAANAGPKNVKVTNAGGAVVSFPGAHIYVLRVQ